MKLIILDRDGVINEDSDAYIKSAEEWHPIPGSLLAMGKLCQAGYTLVVATNQSGIARGYYDLEALHAMHRKMDNHLEAYGGRVDSVFFCPHGPNDKCDCRKPKDGLYRDIARRYQMDLDAVPAIGDSYRDLQAARSAGADPILVKTGKGIQTVSELKQKDKNTIPVFNNLSEAAEHILHQNHES